MRLADRVSTISHSPTMKVTTMVDRLRRDGVEIIDFGAGEPDFQTPDPIKVAGHRAIDEGLTRYTPVAGTTEIRQAVCDRYRADYGVEYTRDHVIVTAGGKQALFNTALTLFGSGDEVIVHTPCWPSLPEQVKLAGAIPVYVPTQPEDGFAIRAEAILAAVTPRTKGVIINSPCNPTGALVSEADLRVIAREARRHCFWIVMDLCYEKLIYDEGAHNLPAVLVAECADQAILCGSASKAYAMTGWRCGWTIAPPTVIRAQAALQSHSTSNASSITQSAAVAALTGSQEAARLMLREYRSRRDGLLEWLSSDPRLRCRPPQGTFYLFLDVGDVLSVDGLRTSIEFAHALLEESRVAVTPGEAFDAPGFIRLSFATSRDNLRKGSERLLAFVAARTPEVHTPE